MSFILDALRKSDQTRQATLPAAPLGTPNSPPTSMMSSTPLLISPEIQNLHRWRWHIAIALPGILLLLVWWYSGSSTPSPSASLPLQPAIITTAPSAVSPAPQAISAPASAPAPIPLPSQKPAVAQSTTRIHKPDAAASVPQPSSASMATPQHQASPPRLSPPERIVPEASESSRSSTSTVAEAKAETELPPDLLAELPKINVAAHSYAQKSKSSFIFANDRMLHEGESLSPGLRLEHITPDGMIFTYKGYRFRRGLQP